MRTRAEILELLHELNVVIADDLEDQTLDFKEHPGSAKELLRMVCEHVVCFANAKGGTLVVGVKDKLSAPNRAQAIRGLPPEFDLDDVSQLQRSVFDSTDPHLTPEMELLDVPEGRLLLIHVAAGENPPYTSTQAPTKRRVGKNCLPLTGSMMRDLITQAEAADFSARLISDALPADLVSSAEMERLRSFGRQNRAPAELMVQGDLELLSSLRLVRDGYLTYAGLLLVGRQEMLARYISTHEWRYLKMRSDTDIEITQGNNAPILAALERIETYLSAANPVTTFVQGFQHAEFKTYPDIAIREAVLNAFVHRDYAIPNLTIVRMLPYKLEVENAGGFMSDITPENILHHPPVHRNRLLADALNGLNLVNRNNLGVKRMYKSMLEQGKEPPLYTATPQSVRVSFHAQELDRGFLQLMNWLGEQSSRLQELISADMLLVLHYLRRYREADLATLAVACQLSPGDTRHLLSFLEEGGAVEHAGYGKGLFYRLSRLAMDQLGDSLRYDRNARLEKEAVKTRVLSLLKERPLTNREVREISDLDREGVKRLMEELREEGLVRVGGRGAGAKWYGTGASKVTSLFGAHFPETGDDLSADVEE
ncbi:RNA-binding domain-containing protein [Deinococcus peraridilitoris]|uniref:Putative transcriptional regulator with HTH domain protein n=1 Tax=Deinococcus peraridilitoris (strain DSM 19664 / LMG 22246 / CIP 109416 / KR-200) TaxID=937777 RepID=L0A174_DEIPD|nr:RNA-binding domain-containing protein [Deinococcus peraridilitoris]AFZ67204.1 putative transcriptional regulator with HTH domain protein [Deinococcus peraridilitoris DSM 19664]